MNVLDRVREICLALPGAYEKVAWSAPTFRVGKRQFAMFVDDHHGDGKTGLWCKAPEGAQEELVASNPECFYVPPYVGPSGWVGIRLDRGLGRRRDAGGGGVPGGCGEAEGDAGRLEPEEGERPEGGMSGGDGRIRTDG